MRFSYNHSPESRIYTDYKDLSGNRAKVFLTIDDEIIMPEDYDWFVASGLTEHKFDVKFAVEVMPEIGQIIAAHMVYIDQTDVVRCKFNEDGELVNL